MEIKTETDTEDEGMTEAERETKTNVLRGTKMKDDSI
jgi:hypothetical protein